MNTKEILEKANVIAVVGCSGNPDRDSYKVPAYLQKKGYTIIPVNPNYDSILGEKCYPNLNAIPLSIQIDIVDIFRKPEATLGVVNDVLTRASKTGRMPIVWTQFNVSSDEAKEVAKHAGLRYVENRCMKVEYSRAFE